MFFEFFLKALSSECADFFCYRAGNLFRGDITPGINTNVFGYLYRFALYCIKIVKFHSLLAKCTKLCCFDHIFAVFYSFQITSHTDMQVIVSCSHFQICTLVCQSPVGCQICVLYLEPRCITEIDHGTVYDIFHFNHTIIIQWCHI